MIQAGKTSFDIGGIDNPVMKDALTGQPYIPGSSLKGKMRSLLEWTVKNGEAVIHAGGAPLTDYSLPVVKIFGATAEKIKSNEPNTQTRIVVRDAQLTQASAQQIQSLLGKGMFTELKPENTIDRLNSKANPRFFERVPRGAKFAGEIVLTLFAGDDEAIFTNVILEGMRLLEDNYLGAGGSRGSGKIRFEKLELVHRSNAYYRGDAQEIIKSIEVK
ncbi:MAG: type III-A CRISPR-associated RAMP protein Csm3, partial [Culicoidibacterales bacterium]